MKSRSFTIIDVPEPRKIQADFFYNFFVNDERTNDAGDPRVKGSNTNLQKMIIANSLQKEVPRYVEVNFDEVRLKTKNSTKHDKKLTQKEIDSINAEETITNVGFAAIRETDDASITRIKQKIEALSKLSNLGFEDAEQSKTISSMLNVSQDVIQDILTPLNDASVLRVNSVDKKHATFFDKSSIAKIHCLVNKRLASSCVDSADDTSPLSGVDISTIMNSISKNFINTAEQFALLHTDVEPIFTPIASSLTNKHSEMIDAETVGYLITRCKHQQHEITETKIFLLEGISNNKLIDTEVLYGVDYTYDIRTIARIDAIVKGNIASDSAHRENHRINVLIASRPSVTVNVRTEEFEAPNEPDGVMYNFNYDAGKGLLIRWQMPVGKSKDTKYFQVFRRKSIFDPFVCIAMLDFDDSQIRTLLREQVNPDRVFSCPGATTFYEDTTFERNSRYIYAIAAVDAHGFSSGYSTQTEVGFDKIKNVLTLKMISRGAAPKQYPNFYVDPSLDDNITVDSFVQDAIFDSGRKKMTVYFTPDAKVCHTAGEASEKVFHTDDDRGSYMFHVINLDLQKSVTASISINNLPKLR